MGDPALATPVGVTLLLYVLGSYALAFKFSSKVESSEDYLVAGRSLSLPLASATLLATWFGAGTLLTAADEVRKDGLRAIALEPLGAAICLLITGFWFARPLWEMKLETLGDFFARRYGKRAELWSSLIMVPGYFGWIAVQLVALASVMELTLGLPRAAGIAVVALVSMGYTLFGGMWAVTVTDAVQLALLLTGLVVLTVQVLLGLGDGSLLGGLVALKTHLPASMLQPVPTATAKELIAWVGVLTVSALGNLPGQELMQRVFAARSAQVARRACLVAGVGYLIFGAMPVVLGLAAHHLAPRSEAVVPALAKAFLSPVTATVFVVAITGAVLSTIDSAILAPAGVLAKNVLPRAIDWPALKLDRACVVGVTAASLAVAYLGESAYELLEAAYGLGMVALFVPLAEGLRREDGSERAAVASMLFGGASWAIHLALGWSKFVPPLLSPLGLELPSALVTTALAWGLFRVLQRDDR